MRGAGWRAKSRRLPPGAKSMFLHALPASRRALHSIRVLAHLLRSHRARAWRRDLGFRRSGARGCAPQSQRRTMAPDSAKATSSTRRPPGWSPPRRLAVCLSPMRLRSSSARSSARSRNGRQQRRCAGQCCRDLGLVRHVSSEASGRNGVECLTIGEEYGRLPGKGLPSPERDIDVQRSSSIPRHVLPLVSAAMRVVPLPMKGS
jgi:hypothetical protein